MKKLTFISNANKALSIFWLVAISLSIIEIAAATSNPGHDFSAIGGGVVQGDLMYGSAADTLSALSKNTSASRYLSNTGASNNPAWAQIDLTNGVTGILPTAKGGTDMAFFTVSGPASTAKTFTFPNANATVLTNNAAVTAAQGGTDQTIYTTGDILYASGTTALSKLADVTAGSYLRSGGTGVAPVWSTVKLPDAAVTAGKVIVSNGTDYIASTPTFPNAAATVRKVIVSDGTNWIASVETYAVPGTSGNVFTSDGTNWTSAAPTVRTVYNQSVSTTGPGFAADTYLVGSSVAIPATGLRVGTRYHLIFQVSKTAAGTATPILRVRFGTLGSVSDTAICTLTYSVQTAAVDTGTFEIWATFRTIGSGTSAVLQCAGQRRHGASVTGFGTLVSETQVATSAGFNSTVGSSIVGTSVNGGTNAAWTITLVQAELVNLP
ncbi:MAG: hypothetical protein EXS50_02680 [Candidatus Taylorbacteria bacterium]|nr:hypothetical protein [Candidatus Taylorbacteria bacterium]